jgi:hypothetical protein
MFRALFIASVLILLQETPGASSGSASQDPNKVRDEQFAALKKEGLEAAARVTGSFVTEVTYPTIGSPASLRELASVSEIILEGIPTSNICVLASNQRSIQTYYSVDVVMRLKGKLPSSLARLVLPGGRVAFADGSWAQLDTPGFRRPQQGRPVLMFLRTVSKDAVVERFREEAVLTSVAGPLGLYDLSGDRGPMVSPFGGTTTPLAQAIYHQRFTPDQFIDEVRRVVAGS